MKRRELLGVIGGAAAWPLGVWAQQPKNVPRIGFLVTGSVESPEARAALKAFDQGLREYGYIDGQNVLVEVRAAGLKVERFPALASELVRLNVDLIVASNSLAARAVQQATTTIPIVVPVMGDPIGDGLVASLARPGGNITGMTFLGPQLVPKRLALLKEALPTVSLIAGLWHPAAYGERTMNDMMNEAEEAARTLGVHLRLVAVHGPTSYIKHFPRLPENVRMPFLYFRALCFSPSEDALSTSPQSVGCPYSPWARSLCSSVDCCLMGRILSTSIASALLTWTRSLKVPNPRTSRSSSRPNLNYSSTSRLRRNLASRFQPRSWPVPTK
jgi:ABC transporter substrate binding protein